MLSSPLLLQHCCCNLFITDCETINNTLPTNCHLDILLWNKKHERAKHAIHKYKSVHQLNWYSIIVPTTVAPSCRLFCSFYPQHCREWADFILVIFDCGRDRFYHSRQNQICQKPTPRLQQALWEAWHDDDTTRGFWCSYFLGCDQWKINFARLNGKFFHAWDGKSTGIKVCTGRYRVFESTVCCLWIYFEPSEFRWKKNIRHCF